MDYISERGRMMNWERHGKKWSCTILSNSRISLEVLTLITNLYWLAVLTEILSWALCYTGEMLTMWMPHFLPSSERNTGEIFFHVENHEVPSLELC